MSHLTLIVPANNAQAAVFGVLPNRLELLETFIRLVESTPCTAEFCRGERRRPCGPVGGSLQMRDAKFGFYEKVRCVSDDPAKASIAGKLCAILGRARNDDGSWGYAIHVYSEPICYHCSETELKSTGEFAKREDFYTGDSVRVSQDGHLVDAPASSNNAQPQSPASMPDRLTP